MKTTFAAILLALPLLAGCATAKPAPALPRSPSDESQAGAETPPETPPLTFEDYKRQLEVEIEPVPLQRVVAQDGSFEGTMETSRAPEITPGSEATLVQTYLGEWLVVCFVYPGAIDLAYAVQRLNDMAFSESKSHEWVNVKADQVNGNAYVMARAHYIRDLPEGKVFGDLKIAGAAMRGETGVVACALDAPGLYASFERTLRGFVDSLKFKAHPPTPHQEESITREQTSGRMVKLVQTRIDQEGSSLVYAGSATMLRIERPDTLAISADFHRRVFQDGSLASGRYLNSSAGHINSVINLTKKGKSYEVEGEIETRAFSASFPVQPAFVDEVAMARTMCKVRDGKLARAELREYQPEANLSQPTTAVVVKDDSAHGNVRLTVEGQNGAILLHLDERCEVTSGAVVTDHVTSTIERIFHIAVHP